MNARSASLLALLAVTAISAAVEAQTTPVAAPPGSEGNLPAGNVLQGIAGASAVREGEVETTDGVRLYYRVEGEGRDTVVVLHGGPSLGHAYLAPDLVPLARGRAVVHYDQRGIGRSTPLTDSERLSVERHVEDLEALQTHLWPEAEAPGSRPASEAPSGPAGFDTVHVAAPTGEREADREELEALTARFIRALNDESWRLLAPFYAPDAILERPGGAVLEGREAILDYFRPIVARIRGVEATSSRTEEDERGVTVTTAYTARFAPVPDPLPATFSNTWARQPDGSWLIVTGTFEPPGDAKAESHGTIRSGYFHSEGVRLHYLDFGGEGMPVLFISSGDRTAYAFMEFAPRFTDRNRVLALSQRGAGPSEGDPAPIVGRDVLGRDIIALLDALGIERAVVAHMWEHVLVYLAEEHPERMAGLVFLEGFPPRGIRTEDPLGIFAMLARNRAAMWGADPEAGQTSDYVPRFLTSGEAVSVPSLLFVDEGRTGESEWEQLVEFARLAGRNPILFPDTVARTYFERLAADEEMQERGRTFWREVVEPVQRAAEEAFHRAFGGSLRTVPVEGRAIGYGYRDAPDVIYPHIRRFLRDRTTIAAEPFRERDGVFALTDVAVVDVASGGLLRGQTVVVAGNRISHVGPAGSVAIPAGARVVAAGGKYLVPGLWDMHVHSSSDRITRETFLPLYLANGVTGVRDMAADCVAPCHELESSFEHVLHWRREIAAGTLVGPRVVAASPMILSPPRGEPSSMERPATAAEARALVRRMKERGVDLLKPYTRLSREAYFALADEARRQGMPVAGHVPLAVRATEASDAGQRSVEHFWGLKEECSEREDELRPRLEAELGERGSMDHYLSLLDSFSEERCGAVAARFVENGTWHVPTLIALEMYERIGDAGWLDDPRLRYVAAEEQEYWRSNLKQAADLWSAGLGATVAMNRRFREIVALMRAAGAGVMAGSDVGDPFVFPGFSLHEELELLVAAGLTPAEALRAATLSPAEYLEATDSHGAVAPGKLADLLLLDANPLEDIRNTQRIHAVVFDGRYYDRQALDDVLAGAEAAASRSGTVQVGSPTGVRDADRTSIPAALKQVRRGSTAQFAPGPPDRRDHQHHYARDPLRVHPDGTTLRGEATSGRSSTWAQRLDPATKRPVGLPSGDAAGWQAASRPWVSRRRPASALVWSVWCSRVQSCTLQRSLFSIRLANATPTGAILSKLTAPAARTRRRSRGNWPKPPIWWTP